MPNRHGKSLKAIEKIVLCLLAAFRRSKPVSSACLLAVNAICLVLMAVSFIPHPAAAAENAHSKYANFEQEHKSENARRLIDWVTDSGNNRGMPFAVVDKTDAKVFVFDAHGRFQGAAPVLVGFARGDYNVPGIGNRKISDIRPEERTTPAGRFVASLGRNFNKKDVLWVDYKGAVSLHRVVTNKPEEHRLERLASPDPLDHRISYGCINVPADFFDKVVKPTFNGTYCVVYILPDTLSLGKVFSSYYDVDFRRGRTATASARSQEYNSGAKNGYRSPLFILRSSSSTFH
jgi:hypothetical protein